MLLTRSPLSPKTQALSDPVRLACVKHAASVHPEPGSNSPTKTKNKTHQKQQAQKMVQARKQSSKNKHQQSKNKTFQNHQHQKNKKQKKPNHPPKTAGNPVNPTQTKQKNTTIENTNNQTTNQPNRPVRVCCEQKISGGFSSPTGFRARQRIQSYRASVHASNQNKQK